MHAIPQRELTHSAAILAEEERCIGRGNNCYLTDWYSWKVQERFHGNKTFFRAGTEADDGKAKSGSRGAALSLVQLC